MLCILVLEKRKLGRNEVASICMLCSTQTTLDEFQVLFCFSSLRRQIMGEHYIHQPISTHNNVSTSGPISSKFFYSCWCCTIILFYVMLCYVMLYYALLCYIILILYNTIYVYECALQHHFIICTGTTQWEINSKIRHWKLLDFSCNKNRCPHINVVPFWLMKFYIGRNSNISMKIGKIFLAPT